MFWIKNECCELFFSLDFVFSHQKSAEPREIHHNTSWNFSLADIYPRSVVVFVVNARNVFYLDILFLFIPCLKTSQPAKRQLKILKKWQSILLKLFREKRSACNLQNSTVSCMRYCVSSYSFKIRGFANSWKENLKNWNAEDSQLICIPKFLSRQ